jgi:hypothetical protein
MVGLDPTIHAMSRRRAVRMGSRRPTRTWDHTGQLNRVDGRIKVDHDAVDSSIAE